MAEKMYNDYELFRAAQARLTEYHREAAEARLSRSVLAGRSVSGVPIVVLRSMMRGLAALLRGAGTGLISLADLLRASSREGGCADPATTAHTGC